jgi:hypothetical protein
MTAVSPKDRSLLRDLAKRVAEIAALPVQAQRRELWRRHNRLERVRPMILVFPEGSWRELLPDSALECRGEAARTMERDLRVRLYVHGYFRDDTVIEREWSVRKAVSDTGWGLEAKRHESDSATGAWQFDPVIKEPADLKKLRRPEVRHDAAESARRLAEAQELFGDILAVRLRGVRYIAFNLMRTYVVLRGLEQIMMDMYENPEMLHEAMAFLAEGYRRRIAQYAELGVLDLNNDGSYHSSGGVGYSDELPKPGYDPARPRLSDLWASAEAQEMALVSPEMHEEFVLQYERRLLEPFGLNGYGCCEDLTLKLDYVLRIPNIRRISISPFADVGKCAGQLGDRAIFSWKPHPAHLVGDFDEAKVRGYIREALAATRGCVVELVLKDTHTCENRPERFTRWTEIARAEVEALGG